MIVASILLAFAIDAWWENRGLSIWEGIQLEALHDEFSDNPGFLNVRPGGEQSPILVDLQAILAFADAASGVQSQSFSSYALTSLIAWRTLELSTSTLDALLAFGDLGQLGSAELRKLLTGWKAWIEDARGKETLAQEFIEFVLTPALLGQNIITPAYLARPDYVTRLQEEDILIASSPALHDLTAVRIGHTRPIESSRARLQSESVKILDLIDNELRRNHPSAREGHRH